MVNRLRGGQPNNPRGVEAPGVGATNFNRGGGHSTDIMDDFVSKSSRGMTCSEQDQDERFGAKTWLSRDGGFCPSPPPLRSSWELSATTSKSDSRRYRPKGPSLPDSMMANHDVAPRRRERRVFLQRTVEPDPGAMLFNLMPVEVCHRVECRRYASFRTVSEPIEFQDSCCE